MKNFKKKHFNAFETLSRQQLIKISGGEDINAVAIAIAERDRDNGRPK